MFPELEFVDIFLVGAYALQFEYSDGHKTGAFSYDSLLRERDES